MRKSLQKAITVLTWLLAALTCLLAVRFVVVAATPMVEKTAASDKKSKSRVRPGSGGVGTAGAGSGQGGAPPALPTLVRMMLSVTHGGNRSEVYVNGELQGLTPYAGDVACKPGDRFKVQIIPTKGAPIEREPLCKGTMVSVAE